MHRVHTRLALSPPSRRKVQRFGFLRNEKNRPQFGGRIIGLDRRCERAGALGASLARIGGNPTLQEQKGNMRLISGPVAGIVRPGQADSSTQTSHQYRASRSPTANRSRLSDVCRGNRIRLPPAQPVPSRQDKPTIPSHRPQIQRFPTCQPRTKQLGPIQVATARDRR